MLCAAGAWLVLALVCGPMWRMAAADACVRETESCCEHPAPEKPACAGGEGCALTCASILVAQLSESALCLTPRVTSARLAADDFCGAMNRERPPVPPPRAARA